MDKFNKDSKCCEMRLESQNNKLEKMMIVLFVFLVGLGSVWMYNQDGWMSYIVAFIGSLGVFWSLFVSARGLATQGQRIDLNEKESCDFANDSYDKDKVGKNNTNFQKYSIDQTQITTKSSISQKISLGFGLSFSFLRILSYTVFSLALIALLELKMFNLYAYMGGVFFALIGVISQILFRKSDFVSKE